MEGDRGGRREGEWREEEKENRRDGERVRSREYTNFLRQTVLVC